MSNGLVIPGRKKCRSCPNVYRLDAAYATRLSIKNHAAPESCDRCRKVYGAVQWHARRSKERACVTCRLQFTSSLGELAWIRANSLADPTRCSDCRVARAVPLMTAQREPGRPLLDEFDVIVDLIVTRHLPSIERASNSTAAQNSICNILNQITLSKLGISPTSRSLCHPAPLCSNCAGGKPMEWTRRSRRLPRFGRDAMKYLCCCGEHRVDKSSEPAGVFQCAEQCAVKCSICVKDHYRSGQQLYGSAPVYMQLSDAIHFESQFPSSTHCGTHCIATDAPVSISVAIVTAAVQAVCKQMPQTDEAFTTCTARWLHKTKLRRVCEASEPSH